MPSFDTARLPSQLAAMERKIRTKGDSQPVMGGEIPGSDGQAAFSLTDHDPSLFPILMAVPHAGRIYPPSLLAQMRNPGPAGLRLEDRHIDRVAQLAAAETGVPLLVAQAPRAMIDLNRSPGDLDSEMVRGNGGKTGRRETPPGWRTRSGLGLIPRRLPGFGELWKEPLEEDDVSARIEMIHVPYHRALGEALDRMRDRWGIALLLDIHSMPPLPAKPSGAPTPVCVLGDRFGASCDATLAMLAGDFLAGEGLAVAHNRPYAGGYVLDRHSAPVQGIHAMQIEFCRSLYLDSHLVEPSEDLPAIAQILARLVRRLSDELGAMAQAKRWNLAAE